jgi:hypothetical protein
MEQEDDETRKPWYSTAPPMARTGDDDEEAQNAVAAAAKALRPGDRFVPAPEPAQLEAMFPGYVASKAETMSEASARARTVDMYRRVLLAAFSKTVDRHQAYHGEVPWAYLMRLRQRSNERLSARRARHARTKRGRAAADEEELDRLQTEIAGLESAAGKRAKDCPRSEDGQRRLKDALKNTDEFRDFASTHERTIDPRYLCFLAHARLNWLRQRAAGATASSAGGGGGGDAPQQKKKRGRSEEEPAEEEDPAARERAERFADYLLGDAMPPSEPAPAPAAEEEEEKEEEEAPKKHQKTAEAGPCQTVPHALRRFRGWASNDSTLVVVDGSGGGSPSAHLLRVAPLENAQASPARLLRHAFVSHVLTRHLFASRPSPESEPPILLLDAPVRLCRLDPVALVALADPQYQKDLKPLGVWQREVKLRPGLARYETLDAWKGMPEGEGEDSEDPALLCALEHYEPAGSKDKPRLRSLEAELLLAEKGRALPRNHPLSSVEGLRELAKQFLCAVCFARNTFGLRLGPLDLASVLYQVQTGAEAQRPRAHSLNLGMMDREALDGSGAASQATEDGRAAAANGLRAWRFVRRTDASRERAFHFKLCDFAAADIEPDDALGASDATLAVALSAPGFLEGRDAEKLDAEARRASISPDSAVYSGVEMRQFGAEVARAALEHLRFHPPTTELDRNEWVAALAPFVFMTGRMELLEALERMGLESGAEELASAARSLQVSVLAAPDARVERVDPEEVLLRFRGVLNGNPVELQPGEEPEEEGALEMLPTASLVPFGGSDPSPVEAMRLPQRSEAAELAVSEILERVLANWGNNTTEDAVERGGSGRRRYDAMLAALGAGVPEGGSGRRRYDAMLAALGAGVPAPAPAPASAAGGDNEDVDEILAEAPPASPAAPSVTEEEEAPPKQRVVDESALTFVDSGSFPDDTVIRTKDKAELVPVREYEARRQRIREEKRAAKRREKEARKAQKQKEKEERKKAKKAKKQQEEEEIAPVSPPPAPEAPASPLPDQDVSMEEAATESPADQISPEDRSIAEYHERNVTGEQPSYQSAEDNEPVPTAGAGRLKRPQESGGGADTASSVKLFDEDSGPPASSLDSQRTEAIVVPPPDSLSACDLRSLSVPTSPPAGPAPSMTADEAYEAMRADLPSMSRVFGEGAARPSMIRDAALRAWAPLVAAAGATPKDIGDYVDENKRGLRALAALVEIGSIMAVLRAFEPRAPNKLFRDNMEADLATLGAFYEELHGAPDDERLAVIFQLIRRVREHAQYALIWETRDAIEVVAEYLKDRREYFAKVAAARIGVLRPVSIEFIHASASDANRPVEASIAPETAAVAAPMTLPSAPASCALCGSGRASLVGDSGDLRGAKGLRFCDASCRDEFRDAVLLTTTSGAMFV